MSLKDMWRFRYAQRMKSLCVGTRQGLAVAGLPFYTSLRMTKMEGVSLQYGDPTAELLRQLLGGVDVDKVSASSAVSLGLSR